jgi:hypothetical protein
MRDEDLRDEEKYKSGSADTLVCEATNRVIDIPSLAVSNGTFDTTTSNAGWTVPRNS